MKITIRSVFCGGWAVFVGLSGLFGLLSVFASASVSGVYSAAVIEETGFDYFSFSSRLFKNFVVEQETLTIEYHYGLLVYAISPLSILLCCVSVATIVFGVLFAAFDKGRKFTSVLLVITCVCSFVYMVFGILGAYALADADGYYMNIKTQAFLPLLLTASGMTVYFIGKNILPEISLEMGKNRECSPFHAPKVFLPSAEKNGTSAVPAETYIQKRKEMVNEDLHIELIERYARLWKEGILSQEEFEAKKRELLEE